MPSRVKKTVRPSADHAGSDSGLGVWVSRRFAPVRSTSQTSPFNTTTSCRRSGDHALPPVAIAIVSTAKRGNRSGDSGAPATATR